MADPYEPSTATLDRLILTFKDHPVAPEQAARLAEVRRLAYELALRLVRLCPPRPELWRALEHLEGVVMLATAAVARGESPEAAALAPPPQTETSP